MEAPTLIQPKPDEKFYLECDASDFATGAILSQKDAEGKLHPVAFYSKSFSPAEWNYDIFDKEMLALIRALKEWRHLLEGTEAPIKVLTDHCNLEHFMVKKVLNRRQVRWANFLADYNIQIKYCPGAQNKKADILSRRADFELPKGGGEPSSILDPGLFLAEISTDSSLDDMIRDALMDDENAKKVVERLEEGEKLTSWKFEDGLLYFQERIFVPREKEVRKAIIESCHDAPAAGHPGRFRTLELLSRKYYWPNMKKAVTAYIQACDSCIRSKHSNQPATGLLDPIDLPLHPWDEITYDLIIGLPLSEGYDAIFTCPPQQQ
ncbi:Transposon Tf2-1 polyprotein [Ceratobasidium theobromae]|uniref:Transposon Tf2-1 polyprotein n=1 Tax=Ceratobasidium theobromae TaxID=1582974 RepID=A0A5N5Q8B0_9AGAM|nr:Transposon Tf2-1 polyprotein [Ceratobasidium theobromae]